MIAVRPPAGSGSRVSGAAGELPHPSDGASDLGMGERVEVAAAQRATAPHRREHRAHPAAAERARLEQRGGSLSATAREKLRFGVWSGTVLEIRQHTVTSSIMVTAK